MSGKNNTQERKLVQAVELSNAEMEKVSGGGYSSSKKGGYSYKEVAYYKEVGYFKKVGYSY